MKSECFLKSGAILKMIKKISEKYPNDSKCHPEAMPIFEDFKNVEKCPNQIRCLSKPKPVAMPIKKCLKMS